MADDDIVVAILTTSRALVGVSARSMSAIESEVTLQQYRALLILAEHGDLNLRSLAEELAIHPSTATRLCDRLVRKGFVDRAESIESRREIVLSLNGSGRALVRTVTKRRKSEIARIVKRMPVASHLAFVAALESFSQAAGEIPDDAWRLGWSQ